jgi:diguanylate cyclase (GGDEF)-like protein
MEKEKLGTILIVDGDRFNTKKLLPLLTGIGFQVTTVATGESALLETATNPPDLILLEILLPEMDGFETCIKLKANPATQDIPVVFLTSLADTESKVTGLFVGAVDYITKPFHPEELLARVNVHFKLYQLTRKVAEQATILQQANQKLQHFADLDGLTQVPNRRRFDQYLLEQWQRLRQKEAPLSLILADVDYFKLYNDRYGHLAGDNCLKQVALAIKCSLPRPDDLVARYGGEEFAIILPDTELASAIQVAEMIHTQVQQLKIVNLDSEINKYITISLGVSSQIPDRQNSPQSLMMAADRALYQAKKQGRNQTVISSAAAPAQREQ